MSWLRTFKDFWAFLVGRRLFVLMPLIAILLLMALFILLAEIPVLTPFIYAIF